jgi:hypothetical protein
MMMMKRPPMTQTDDSEQSITPEQWVELVESELIRLAREVKRHRRSARREALRKKKGPRRGDSAARDT